MWNVAFFLTRTVTIGGTLHLEFATLETRRMLARVNFRKDVRECYWGEEQKWPIADQCIHSNDPRNNYGTHFGSSSLIVSKVANELFYVAAKQLVFLMNISSIFTCIL